MRDNNPCSMSVAAHFLHSASPPDSVLCAKQTLLGVGLSWCDHLSHQLKLPSLCLPHGLLKPMSEDTHR